MSIFSADVNESNGRTGLIEIDNKKVATPSYAPTKNEFESLSLSSGIDKKDYRDIEIGEVVCWLDKDQLTNIVKKDGFYNSKKYALSADLKIITAKTKILHFNFFSDVKSLNGEQIENLLELQYDLDVDVIQIPNHYIDLDYSRAVEKAIEWKRSKGVNKPLMGVVCKSSQIDYLKTKFKEVESIGINLSQFNQPTLVAVRNKLKTEDVWIHGISAPMSHENKRGTLGVLINYYGFDTISNPVQNSKSARGFGGSFAKMNAEQQLEKTKTQKYFKPIDYELPKIEDLQKIHGSKHKLSGFCSCPICTKKTIEDLLINPTMTSHFNKSHRSLSFH